MFNLRKTKLDIVRLKLNRIFPNFHIVLDFKITLRKAWFMGNNF